MDRTLRLPLLLALALGSNRLRAQENPAPEPPPAVPAEPTPAEPAAPAPATPAAPAADERPRGLLGIAEAESQRAAVAMRERIRVMLRNFTSQRETAADRGKGFLDTVVLLGPDAVPLLLEVMREVDRGTLDAAYAGAAARALCGIFERTHAKSILASLAETVRSGGAGVQAGALEGLEQLDHAQVIEIVAPLLEVGDPALRGRAVRVLGRQQSSASLVGGLLLPLLAQQGAPWTETVQALHALGEKSALEPVQQFLAKSEDSSLLLAGVRYVADLGGRATIPALRALLLRQGTNLPETLLKQAIDSAQSIGLRETDAHSGAEELLLEVFKKLRESRKPVSDYARWQLGPFGTEEALKSFEDEINDALAVNKRLGQPNTSRYLELAEDRLQFGAWSKAIDALNRAKDEDSRRLRSGDIEELRAVALCGQGKFPAAERILQTVHPDQRQALLQRFKVLEKMAKHKDYKELFASGR